jgi:hypothetical protein
MNLTNQIQAQEYLNKQLNERLAQKELQATVNVRESFINDLCVILRII